MMFRSAVLSLLLCLGVSSAWACTVPAVPSRSASDETDLLQKTGFLLVEGGARKYSPAAMADYEAETILSSIASLRQADDRASKGTLFHLRVAGMGLRDTKQTDCFFAALYAQDELRLINDMLIMSRQLERDRNALPIAKALIRLANRASGDQVHTVLQEMGVMTYPDGHDGRADTGVKPQLDRRAAAHLPNLIMRALATRLYKDTDASHAIVYAIAGMGYSHR